MMKNALKEKEGGHGYEGDKNERGCRIVYYLCAEGGLMSVGDISCQEHLQLGSGSPDFSAARSILRKRSLHSPRSFVAPSFS